VNACAQNTASLRCQEQAVIDRQLTQEESPVLSKLKTFSNGHNQIRWKNPDFKNASLHEPIGTTRQVAKPHKKYKL
jgi:hypothetical protein